MFWNKKEEYIFNENIKEIIVLGLPGCSSCLVLFNNIKKVLAEFGTEKEPVYICDLEKVKEYGVMTVPTLIIDGRKIFEGKSVSVSRLREILGQKN